LAQNAHARVLGLGENVVCKRICRAVVHDEEFGVGLIAE
jgi:hypothetical protein